MAQRCGGASEEKEATAEIQAFCDELKEEILQKSGKSSASLFKALKYTSQIVAGTNYFVKIQIDENGESIHARIFMPLPHTGGKCELSSVQANKSREDAIEYF